MRQSPRALVFDVDGVLIAPWRFRSVLAAEHGLHPETTAEFFLGPFVDCTLGKAELEPSLAPFLERWGWPGTLDDFLRLWFDADGEVDTRLISTITELRRAGLPVHVASTQERRRAEHLVRDLGLGKSFDRCFFSWELGVAKPDQAFFAKVAEALGQRPDELHFFDDGRANVRAARRAGWGASRFTDRASFERELERLVPMR